MPRKPSPSLLKCHQDHGRTKKSRTPACGGRWINALRCQPPHTRVRFRFGKQIPVEPKPVACFHVALDRLHDFHFFCQSLPSHVQPTLDRSDRCVELVAHFDQ